MKRVLFYTVLVGLLLNVNAFAVEVSGDVSGEWIPENNPYEVIGDLHVPPNQSLIINAGCYIEFQGHYTLIVDNGADFIALGTENDSIVFTAVDTDSGWNSININSAGLVDIQYCVFEYGKTYEWQSLGGAIGIYYSNVSIRNCYFTNNYAFYGGGVCNTQNSTVTIENCVFFQNTGRGGGAFCNGGTSLTFTATLKNNWFIQNRGIENGGAYQITTGTVYSENNVFWGNTCESNLGGAIYAYGGTSYNINDTFYDNTPNGIDDYGGSVYLRNSILWETEIIGGLEVTYSDIQGGYPGEGNIDLYPLFKSPETGNFDLQFTSPCVDAGDPADPVPPGGGDRIDMGAFEYFSDSYALIYNPQDFNFEIKEDSSIIRTFSIISNDVNGYVKIFCDSSWVTLDADSIEFSPYDTAVVTVVFDAIGLVYDNIYVAEIYFESNPTTMEDVVIPIEMTVLTPVPVDIAYSLTDFIFDITGDSTVTRTFSLSSIEQTGSITPYVPLIAQPYIVFDPDTINMYPGDTVEVTVTFNSLELDYNKTYRTWLYFDSEMYGLADDSIRVKMTTRPPIPITIGMNPHDAPVIVEQGQYFVYDGSLTNNLEMPIPYYTDTWIKIERRGIYFGPLELWEDISVHPGTITYTGIEQWVSPTAVLGDYTYLGYCGEYPDIMDSCYFEFTVVEGFNREGHGWDVYGWGDDIVSLPSEVTLYQNYPNPFNAATEIRYAIPEQSNVRLDIYNIRGQKVDMISNGIRPAGEYPMLWDASKYSSGIYFYKLTTNNKVLTKRMTLLK